VKKDSDIPKSAVHSERMMLALLPGTAEVLSEIASDAGFSSASAFVRGLAEREIRDARPADFARIKGVG